MGLNFIVDLLLLLGTNRLAGYPAGLSRSCLAAAVGGLYGGVCLLPGFRFLGNTLWRMVSLGLMGTIAFGLGKSTLRRCMLFVLLSMALGGLALSLGGGSIPVMLGAAGLLIGLCAVGFRGKDTARRRIPLELHKDGRQIRLLALYDTGNTLRDPLTGESVAVAGAQAAKALLGLSREQLKKPAAFLTPGLRLIPYKAVGLEGSMLLCARFRDAKVDGKRRDLLVAFAPEGLEEEYQALIGGSL